MTYGDTVLTHPCLAVWKRGICSFRLNVGLYKELTCFSAVTASLCHCSFH